MSKQWQVDEARYSDMRIESCLRDENQGDPEWRKETIKQRQEEAEELRKDPVK
jgi:hypothetical protein